jgi:hypothetical protein
MLFSAYFRCSYVTGETETYTGLFLLEVAHRRYDVCWFIEELDFVPKD